MKFLLSEDKFDKDVIAICNTPVNNQEFVDAIKCASEENLKIALKLLQESPMRTKKKEDLIKNEIRIISTDKMVNHHYTNILKEWDDVMKLFKKGVEASA